MQYDTRLFLPEDYVVPELHHRAQQCHLFAVDLEINDLFRKQYLVCVRRHVVVLVLDIFAFSVEIIINE